LTSPLNSESKAMKSIVLSPQKKSNFLHEYDVNSIRPPTTHQNYDCHIILTDSNANLSSGGGQGSIHSKNSKSSGGKKFSEFLDTIERSNREQEEKL
jgi:hypothetical protein